MPKVGVMQRPLIPAGEHTLTLSDVTEVDVENSFKPGEMVKKWVWLFEAEALDEDDQPYEHKEWTKTVYGHPKANLTLLLNQLVPGITQETAKNFDTATLVGKRFKAMIRHQPNDKGQTVADLAYIAPEGTSTGTLKPANKKAAASSEIPF